jgi:hypothetical protein
MLTQRRIQIEPDKASIDSTSTTAPERRSSSSRTLGGIMGPQRSERQRPSRRNTLKQATVMADAGYDLPDLEEWEEEWGLEAGELLQAASRKVSSAIMNQQQQAGGEGVEPSPTSKAPSASVMMAAVVGGGLAGVDTEEVKRWWSGVCEGSPGED